MKTLSKKEKIPQNASILEQRVTDMKAVSLHFHLYEAIWGSCEIK